MRPNRFVLNDASASGAALVCLLGLGGFLLWAGLVPLAEGVAVSGQIVAEDNRKVVQHLEGGILRKLAVREGALVQHGDVLLELEDVRVRSERDQLSQTVAGLRASLDRLTALTAMQGSMAFSPVNDLSVAPAVLAQIRTQQLALFRQQRAALSADMSVLGARGSALQSDAQAKARQIAVVEQSLALVRKTLTERRALLSERLIRRDTVDELGREQGRLEGELARLATERGGSIGQAGEVRQQAGKSRADFMEEASAAMLEARTELADAEERLRAAQDVLSRTVVRAPRAGKVLNLKFTTLGGVVRGGEPILEIVPESDTLIAQVQVRPNTRDPIYVGLPVTAKLHINKSWTAPQLSGRVLDVSGDLKTVPETGMTFYEARVSLDRPAGLRDDLEVLPGMPVEAFVNSGTKRTFLSYLVEPIQTVVRRGL